MFIPRIIVKLLDQQLCQHFQLMKSAKQETKIIKKSVSRVEI